MKIQAEVSLYPLREDDLFKGIYEFLEAVRERGLDVQMGPMSSLLTGESEAVFQALQAAFDRVAERTQCVLVAKLSNACPIGTDDAELTFPQEDEGKDCRKDQ